PCPTRRSSDLNDGGAEVSRIDDFGKRGTSRHPGYIVGLAYRGHFGPEYGRHNKVCAGVDEPLGSVGVEYRTDAHDEILVLARMGEQFGKHVVSIATPVCEFKYA